MVMMSTTSIHISCDISVDLMIGFAINFRYSASLISVSVAAMVGCFMVQKDTFYERNDEKWTVSILQC